MKKLKIMTLNLLCLILIAALFGSCMDYGQDYKYTYTIKVTYTNSAVDTLTFSYESFKGNNVYVKLKITENGLFGSSGTSPCLIVGCGFYRTPIACGVRKYKILNEAKTDINNPDHTHNYKLIK